MARVSINPKITLRGKHDGPGAKLREYKCEPYVKNEDTPDEVLGEMVHQVLTGNTYHFTCVRPGCYNYGYSLKHFPHNINAVPWTVECTKCRAKGVKTYRGFFGGS